MHHSLRSFTLALLFVVSAAIAHAEPVTFKSLDDAAKAYRVSTRVKCNGTSTVAMGGGRTKSMQMTARAEFAFNERRLPAGGRDALSLRAAREFEIARMDSSISSPDDKPGDAKSEVSNSLPGHCRFIVAEGHTTGVSAYCPSTPLTRESVDLLEIPGDPLALAALFPHKPVDVNETWTPPEWAGQMLAAIEAIEKSELKCKLASATASEAVIEVSGSIKGQRQGTNCTVTIAGTISYDRALDAIRDAKLTYTVKSEIGVVSPGLDASMEVETHRQPVADAGRLTEKAVAAIPISADASAKDILYEVPTWGLRLRMSRDWYFFQHSVEGDKGVAIFRLMEDGSLFAQCNLSPIPGGTPGQHVSLEQFEKDIQASLGKRFEKFIAREQVNVNSGLKVFRVVAEGFHTFAGPKGEIKIPTTWIYYLCAAPSGKQASFVFAVESKLKEKLNSRDEQFVQSLQFVAERAAKAQ